MAKDKELVIKLRAEVSAANKALKDAKDRVKELEVAQSNLDKRTKGGRAVVEQYRASLRQLEVQEKKLLQSKTKLTIAQRRANIESKSLNKSLTGTSQASGAATSAVLEMGRVVQDSNYGIRGMANNITQLASQLVFAHKSAGGFTATIKSLGSSLMGSGGLLLIISLVVAALEKWDSTMSKVEQKAKGLSEALGGEAGTISKLLTYAEVVDSAKKETNEYKNAMKELKDKGFDPATQSLSQFIDEQIRLIKVRAKAKVVEDEKQYQRDKLRLYQMHRTYLEEVGASVGATVVSPVRVPRR